MYFKNHHCNLCLWTDVCISVSFLSNYSELGTIEITTLRTTKMLATNEHWLHVSKWFHSSSKTIFFHKNAFIKSPELITERWCSGVMTKSGGWNSLKKKLYHVWKNQYVKIKGIYLQLRLQTAKVSCKNS